MAEATTTEPKTNIDYEKIYDSHADTLKMFEYEGRAKTHEYRRFNTFLDLAKFPKDSKILDSGAGDGPMTVYFAQNGFKNITGMDISQKRIDRLNEFLHKNNLPGKGLTGDVFNHPFEDSAYDVVISSEVIEHLHDPDKALRDMVRVLKPGGTLLLSTMENENVRKERCIHCNKLTPHYGHVQIFSEKRLREMFSKAGLEIEAVRHVLSTLNSKKSTGAIFNRLPFWLWKIAETMVRWTRIIPNRWIVIRARKVS
ncbi:methyltransferase domain-containing protein [Patescibacteria group bacterium]